MRHIQYLIDKWSDLSLRAKGFFIVAIPAAALVIVACAAYAVTAQASTAERSVYNELRAQDALERMKASAIAASAAIRGFFVTGDPSHLATVRETIAQFDASRQEALALTVGNSFQQQRLGEIAAIQLRHVERIFEDIETFRSGRLNKQSVAKAVLTGNNERLHLEHIIDVMQTEEMRSVDANRRRADWLRGGMTAIIGMCLLLGLWGAIVMPHLFAAGITARIAVLTEAMSRLATGDSPGTLPEGRDEIGRLSAGIGDAATVLRQKTTAIENASHGIAMVGADGECRWCNRVYLALTRLPRGSRGTMRDVLLPEDRAKLDQALEQMREQGRGETQFRIAPPEGESIDAAVTLLPACGDRVSGYYIFLLDVTAQKRMDAELIHAKEAAEAANAAKSAFLAKVSHEIRTPMNAVLGAADLLAESPLAPEQEEYVGIFRRNCRSLVTLINDFLDFAKIEAGAVRLDQAPFRIRDTVREAVETFQETAVRKGVTLAIDIADAVPEYQVGDSLRIQQVLMNLVSNALKFTVRGAVRVRVFVSGGTMPRLRFSVSDSGLGIRQEDQEKLFSPFTQLAQPEGAQVPGSGLGLTICREIVQLMGGEIWLTSQAGAGSTFYFTIPLEVARPAGRPEAQASSRAPLNRPMRNMQVLLAEDWPDNRLLLHHYLKDEPVTLRFAENGQQAVDEVLSGDVFDLILMDLDMPVLSGLDAARQIRDWQRTNGVPLTPILAISAHALPDQVEASLQAGCAAHITKPVDRVTLLETIYRFLPASPELAANETQEEACPEIPVEVAALVPQYLASKWTQLEEANAHLAIRDLDAVRRFGHNLKGTGRGYGFVRLEEIGRQIETAATRGEPSEVTEQLQRLRDFLSEAAPLDARG